MPRPVSSGLNAVRRKLADGTTTTDFYHRRSGALLGRERDGMTRDQAVALSTAREAPEAPRRPPTGSFGELAALYLGSTGYGKKAPRTKAEYADHIEILREAWEAVPLAGITRKAVAVFHAGYRDRPFRGNAILRTLRLVLNYGKDELQLPELAQNPVEGFEMFDTRPRDQVWPQHHIDAVLQIASELDMPRVRKAMALLLYSVQRLSDVLAMGTPMVWVGEGRTWIRLRQAKTGALLDVPCHAVLAEEMLRPEPAPPRIRKGTSASTLLLPSPTGLPWSRRNFSRTWDRVIDRVNLRLARQAMRARGGLPRNRDGRAKAKAIIRAGLILDLQRRDLRRTGVVQMALAGATVPQIAAIAGWKIDYTQAIIDTYLPRRRDVAALAMDAWEAAPGPSVIPMAPRRR
ncbi:MULTISPECIES: site-specific integrase [Roseomonadaceae]|uniref:Integrase n=1 Tax=Falsiroseomonas oleicola TaxID=2801474 RepID=A0ABS6H5J4_9PROT|nr:integrase [Roseomonas oleicola]MBU8543962.1 integrase [Roseomonas oleicola]